jgi:hypothetical protein
MRFRNSWYRYHLLAYSGGYMILDQVSERFSGFIEDVNSFSEHDINYRSGISDIEDDITVSCLYSSDSFDDVKSFIYQFPQWMV